MAKFSSQLPWWCAFGGYNVYGNVHSSISKVKDLNMMQVHAEVIKKGKRSKSSTHPSNLVVPTLPTNAMPDGSKLIVYQFGPGHSQFYRCESVCAVQDGSQSFNTVWSPHALRDGDYNVLPAGMTYAYYDSVFGYGDNIETNKYVACTCDDLSYAGCFQSPFHFAKNTPISDCTCHVSCKSCGYHESKEKFEIAATKEMDCIHCTSGYTFEGCKDDPAWKGKDGGDCASWSGYNCFTTYSGWDADRMKNVRDNCPVSCGSCTAGQRGARTGRCTAPSR